MAVAILELYFSAVCVQVNLTITTASYMFSKTSKPVKLLKIKHFVNGSRNAKMAAVI